MAYLIIDDDEDITDLLQQYFAQFQIELAVALTPSQGFALLQERAFDCLILDVMLPEMDGFAVLKRIRKRSNIPIIMLTARGDVTDRIVGLEIGADDYLPKPFEPRELLARCQSLTRRASSDKADSGLIAYRGLSLNTRSKRVWVDDREIHLTSMEYDMLELMASNRDKVYSRDDLLNELKGIDAELFTRSIDITVSRLRQKLRNSHNRQFIQTVWGRGYQFVGEDA